MRLHEYDEGGPLSQHSANRLPMFQKRFLAVLYAVVRELRLGSTQVVVSFSAR